MSQEMEILASSARTVKTGMDAALIVTAAGAEIAKGVTTQLAIPLAQFMGRNAKKPAKVAAKLIKAFFVWMYLLIRHKGPFKGLSLDRLLEKSSGQLVFFEINTEDKKKLADIKKQMEKLKIDFSEIPDLRKGDGKTQFAIAPQDIQKLQLLVRNNLERFKAGTSDVSIDIIDMENYILNGYDGNEPTPELQELFDEAEKDYKEEQEKEQKREQKKKGRSKTPDGKGEVEKNEPEAEKFASLDRALDRQTNNTTGDKFFVVADAKDPSKYIICKSEKDIFDGKEYLRTQYELHSGDSIKKYDDRRFEGRAKSYWYEMKKLMMKSGGFSGSYLRFHSYESFVKWSENVKEGMEKDGSGSRQIDGREFFAEYAKAIDVTEDSHVVTISADNLIHENPDGSRIFDIPEQPGFSVLIPANRVLSENSGKEYKLNIRHDENYVMIKKDGADIDYVMPVSGRSVGTFWKNGSLAQSVKKKQNLERNTRSLRKHRTDLAKEFGNESMEDIAKGVLHKSKGSK